MALLAPLIAFEKLNEISKVCIKFKCNIKSRFKECQYLKLLIRDLSNCDYYHAVESWFSVQDGNLPLQCLWHLQSHNLVQFTSYLFLKPVSATELVERFEDEMWYVDETEANDRGECVTGLLAVLVNLGPHSTRELYRIGQDILTETMRRFIERLLSSDFRQGVERPVDFLPALPERCAHSRLRVFRLSLVRLMLARTDRSISLEQAVSQLAEFTSAKTSPEIIRVLSFCVSEDTEDWCKTVVREIGEFASDEQKPPDWRWLLTLVSVLASSSRQASDALKRGVEGWLSTACASRNTSLLAAAILGVRQAGSYAAWFGALRLRSTPAFTFLFDFLSQIVPHEPPLYLKVHVNRVPATPSAECRSALAEYAALARSRLADLGQSAADYVGLFGEYDNADEQEGRKADVQKVVAIFERTGEVSKAVLEASVFRREFYQKVFLAELLRSKDPERGKFIEKLYSIGKIPHGLYSQWKEL